MSIKKPRLYGYDYASNGFYFITIVTHYRQPLLMGINRDVVAQFIGQLNEISGVSIDYFTVMDDHVHMILVLNECHLILGEVVRRFKARTTHEFKAPLWQPNYYEHVIRNEQALLKIREYIQNNPQAEKIKWEEIYEGLPDNSRGYTDLASNRSRAIKLM
ncbi:MAG: transposase [Chlamydiae bacterium]|nr:transposase [Chlamydiota bacterium]MBI3277068.1 transposase [Chlamydiota bacterium]